jgi:3-hydroxybutyryl-CoA dehydrogenase
MGCFVYHRTERDRNGIRTHDVYITDVNEEILNQAKGHVRENMKFLAENGIGKPEDIEPAIDRIKTTTSMKKALADAQFVIEAVSENLALKQNIFQEMEAYCSPETVLATNTSVISITKIAEKTRKKGRVVGTHFWFPPYLIPLVEVIKGSGTLDAVMDFTCNLLQRVGKHPIKCLKDVPGFVANRLQHALWREAISIVENGIADAATVDEAIKNSIGIRLAVLGPCENADMVGLDLTLAIHNTVLRDLEASPEPSPLLYQKVEEGELGMKSGKGFYPEWSDEQIKATRQRVMSYLTEYVKKYKN